MTTVATKHDLLLTTIFVLACLAAAVGGILFWQIHVYRREQAMRIPLLPTSMTCDDVL